MCDLMLRDALAAETPAVRRQATISVPRRSRKDPCRWGTTTDPAYVNLPVGTMVEALDFVLDNTLMRMPDGQLMRQVGGIPMGDPISPANAIGTTAWMELEWMRSLDQESKKHFRAKRYVDDILVIYNTNAEWRGADFIRDFKESTCYMAPLRLEPGAPDVFLETKLEKVARGEFTYRLKNTNEDGVQRVWRYTPASSYTPYSQKVGLIAGLTQKCIRMASDTEQLRISLRAKVAELRQLGYSGRIIRAGIYAVSRQKFADEYINAAHDVGLDA